MKNLVIILVVIAVAAVSFAFVNAPKDPSEVILIRGYVWIGNANVNTIKVYHGSAPAEIIEIPKVKSKEAFDEDLSKVLEVVNKYTAQGYQLVSSTELGGNASVILDFTLSK